MNDEEFKLEIQYLLAKLKTKLDISNSDIKEFEDLLEIGKLENLS